MNSLQKSRKTQKLANKPVIAVDIDDVLSSSAAEFVKFSNQKWGTSLRVDDYDEHWARMWKVDDKEVRSRTAIVTSSKLPLRYSPLEEAKNVLHELSKRYKLVVATSRNKTMQGMTVEWIREKYEDIFDEVHFAGLWDKDMDLDLLNKLTKAELCAEIGADYLIDDQPKHCIAAAEAGIKTILFGNYKWNKDVSDRSNMVKAKDWREVLEYFNGKS
jgi:5'(3')-deoxyribonucleotidase